MSNSNQATTCRSTDLGDFSTDLFREGQNQTIVKYCIVCHSQQAWFVGLALYVVAALFPSEVGANDCFETH